MFGGYGIYHEDIIFAIIAEDELYFKVANNNRAQYEKHESKPFTYRGHKDRKPTVMSYWLVPEEITNDAELIEQWLFGAKEAHNK